MHHRQKTIASLLFPFFFFCYSISFWSCEKSSPSSDFKIRLHYYYQTTLPNQNSIQTGLKWVLSYLGATLSPGQLELASAWENSEQILTLDLSQVGFNNNAQNALFKILQHIKNSPAYQKKHSIDIGRFVMLTLNSSHHYYAITGVYPSYQAFEAAYNFEDSALVHLAAGSSTVSQDERIIFQTKDSIFDLLQQAFIAKEGISSSLPGTWQADNLEVFDFMPNGQPRFAIYNTSGNLIPASPTQFGLAGKPAKCMWCHESNIQYNFISSSHEAIHFNHVIDQKRIALDSIRASFVSDLDYQQLQEHSLAELLYVTFMEPSAERLAQEWELPIQEIQNILQAYTPHSNPEYPQLGQQLYHRSEIDHLGPYSVLQVPESAREPSLFEPNY